MNDGNYVNVNIHDTGGQEKFNGLNKQYYKMADCILLVYDITERSSFEEIDYYIKEIKNNCNEDIKVILLGNKSDLKDKRDISQEEGANLADKNHFMFRETSCEQNYNVADAFESIIILTVNEKLKREEKEEKKQQKQQEEKEEKEKTCENTETLGKDNQNESNIKFNEKASIKLNKKDLKEKVHNPNCVC